MGARKRRIRSGCGCAKSCTIVDVRSAERLPAVDEHTNAMSSRRRISNVNRTVESDFEVRMPDSKAEQVDSRAKMIAALVAYSL